MDRSKSLLAGARASPWIPLAFAYDNAIYPGQTVSTTLELILRMYYPTPGDQPPSILPYSSGSTSLPESYVPPLLELESS